MTTQAICKDCDRPCVPASTHVDRVPEGHKRYRAKGLCEACYKSEQRRKGRWPSRYKACANPKCTVVRVVKTSRPNSSGLCRKCHYAAKRTEKEDAATVIFDGYEESEVELTGGEWVRVRGVKRYVKREESAALPTSRVQRGTTRVQHGTDSGYYTHRRQTHGWPKEACQPCKQAHAAKQSETARVKREEAAA